MSKNLQLAQINDRIVRCRRCTRLLTHCREVANVKVARFRDQTYWGKPVPNLIPKHRAERAKVLIVGLAPGAHGANRTGRMFTGDRSGDFLYAAMYRAGLCNQPDSVGPGDGLELIDTVVTSAGHCAPPGNKPTRQELEACRGFLDMTFDALRELRVVVSLGGIAHRAVLERYRRRGIIQTLSHYPFSHGRVFTFDLAPAVVTSYHPSQQNTFTGRLTPEMLAEVMMKARELADQ